MFDPKLAGKLSKRVGGEKLKMGFHLRTFENWLGTKLIDTSYTSLKAYKI
jgi:hypothetical protein